MSTLTDKLAKLLAFDVAWARRDLKQALIDADTGNDLSDEQTHHLVLMCIKSAQWENARLQPLHEKLLRCVEALEKTPTSHSILCNSLRCPEHCARAAKDAALAELRKECGE